MLHRKRSTQDIGAAGEQIACDYLAKNGYAIMERNFRVRGGEIDIIAKKDGQLCFIEVKLRMSDVFGLPEQYVTRTKLSRIHFAMKKYLATHGEFDNSAHRIEIIAIMHAPPREPAIHHIRDIVV